MSKSRRIVGISNYTHRVYVQVESAYYVLDHTEYLWSKSLVHTTAEEVLVDQLMGEWTEIDQECQSMSEMYETGKKLSKASWRWVDQSEILERRLEINLMASERRKLNWFRRIMILCKLRLRGIKPPWKMFTNENPDTDSEEP